MNVVKSLMGRRQFLIAAGVTSTTALASKNLPGIFNQASQGGVAMAYEKSGIAGKVSNRYRHLLSPLRIGNVVLKNRLMQTVSFPRFMQGPETFPSEQIINHYGNIAKNGAAIVMCVNNENSGIPREEMRGEGRHFPIWNCDDVSVQHYFAQMADAIHFHGSKASMSLGAPRAPEGYNISNAALPYGDRGIQGKEVPVELIQKMIGEIVDKARLYQYLGYDMVHFHMSYHNTILAHALSPVFNKRTDKYGGGLENRARLALELFQAIKKACGQDFLIGAHMSGEEGLDGGYTVQDAVQYAKVWEGALDIIKVRGKDEKASHPSGYDSIKGKPVTLPYAQAIKEGDAKIVVAPVGGYQDLDFNEGVIASGKADMIAMARGWIADPEYGKKAYEGRGEDVVPCLWCGICAGGDASDMPPLNICAVNPKFGIAHKVEKMVAAPAVSKKVAVIGGGPAGMKAALTAAERGHKVTLYEKNDLLGGQLRFTDFASFKWPHRDFKDYLIRQVKKAAVEVFLDTKATPEMIKTGGFDAVLIATGAEPIIPDYIPGVKGGNVLTPIFVFGNKNIGKDVVVIGSDRIGMETGMYLTENGHNVTMIKEKRLANDSSGITGLRPIEGDTIDGLIKTIIKGKVTYTDAEGDEKYIRADSVVVSAGRRPRLDEAMKFSDSAEEFIIIGDCHEVGDVRKSQRTAFAAASGL